MLKGFHQGLMSQRLKMVLTRTQDGVKKDLRGSKEGLKWKL